MAHSPPTLTFVEGMLHWDGGKENQPPGSDANWHWDPRVEDWQCDAYHYSSILKAAGRDNLRDKAANFMVSPKLKWKARKTLRKRQKEGLAAWLEHKKGLVVLPTGVGKTQVALEAILQLNVPTLIVVPVRPLMYQWAEELKEAFGIDCGLRGDSRKSIAPVTVTTYATACMHVEELGNRFQLLVFDECHNLPGEVRGDAAAMSIAP